MKRLAWVVGLFGSGLLWGQGPTVSPVVVPTFTYTMNSGKAVASQTVKVTLPTGLTGLPIVVQNILVASTDCSALSPPVPPPCGWLAVTPDQGHAPLTLTVSVNPTGLTPGSYPGSFVVDTLPGSGSPVKVTVLLQVANPPSYLLLSSTSSNFTASSSATSAGSLSFQYTTGTDASTLAFSELDISSSGDIIPFNVTASNASGGGSSGSSAVWLRVSSKSPTQGAALTTSGSAGVGSLVPIFVTIDYATVQGLGIGQYFGTITITSTTDSKMTKVVSVTLVISAGPPGVSAIFPASLVPAPATDPVFTVYGSNFTLNTSVYLYLGAVSHQIPMTQLQLVSPKILKVTVLAKWLPPVVAPDTYPYLCKIEIQNGGFPAVDGYFQLTDPAAPSISLIVNAASYQPVSKFTGTGTDPAAPPNPQTAVSPRGVISIFGQNLGPSVVSSAVPVPASGGNPSYYDVNWGGLSVTFSYIDPVAGPSWAKAPILMISSNQINAIVPKELFTVVGSTATVKVTIPVSIVWGIPSRC